MKVVLLAGGLGTRISEESQLKPKPMIEIGGMPIIWHIMKEYSHYGFNEFVVCCGYKQEIIKSWFANYYLYNSDVTFDLKNGNQLCIHSNVSEPWKVTLVDTGLDTMTGGRIKRIKEYIEDSTFLLTYGDGVSDVNIKELMDFHNSMDAMATLTAVQPEGRFGVLEIEGKHVRSFREKSSEDVGWINAGYMVLEPQVLDYIVDDSTVFEREPLEKIASMNQLAVYKHGGFWQCMDTLKDKMKLEELWRSGEAPWKAW